MKIHRILMFVYIRSAAFVMVVSQNLVLQQSKNVTAKCTETQSPPPSIQFSICWKKLSSLLFGFYTLLRIVMKPIVSETRFHEWCQHSFVDINILEILLYVISLHSLFVFWFKIKSTKMYLPPNVKRKLGSFVKRYFLKGIEF